MSVLLRARTPALLHLEFFRVHVLMAVIALLGPGAHGAEFIAGADFSHLGFFEDRGIVYKDGGESQDALADPQTRRVELRAATTVHRQR